MRLMAGNSPCRTPSGPFGLSWNVYKIASVLPPEKNDPRTRAFPHHLPVNSQVVDKARRKTAFAEEPGRPPPLPPRRQT